MIKDSIYKTEINIDKSINKEKQNPNINNIKHNYDNNININDKLTSLTKSNVYELNKEGMKPLEENQTSSNREVIGRQLSYSNELPNTTNLMQTDSLNNSFKRANIDLGNFRNEMFEEGMYDSNMFGLEEKATNTDELTSTKIDELLSINEQFLKCKEHFVFYCVKNQPDILAKMFPELFKKHKQNVTQNLISGIKRKRELGFKPKPGNPAFKKHIHTLDKRRKEHLDQRNKNNENSEGGNSSSPIQGAKPKGANSSQDHGVLNKQASNLSFSSKVEKEIPEKLDKSENKGDKVINSVGPVVPEKREKRKYRSAAMKLRMANEAKLNSLNLTSEVTDIKEKEKEKENNFSFVSSKFSEICEVFNLSMPSKTNVTIKN